MPDVLLEVLFFSSTFCTCLLSPATAPNSSKELRYLALYWSSNDYFALLILDVFLVYVMQWWLFLSLNLTKDSKFNSPSMKHVCRLYLHWFTRRSSIFTTLFLRFPLQNRVSPPAVGESMEQHSSTWTIFLYQYLLYTILNSAITVDLLDGSRSGRYIRTSDALLVSKSGFS